MQRFAVKKWWSVVGSDKGVFVYYDEAQAMIDRLRADRDRHRNDNKLLWEQIADKQAEIKALKTMYSNSLDKRWQLEEDFIESRFVSILGWGLFVITLIITVVVLRGGVL